jgi:DpnD/PcfM-like protein
MAKYEVIITETLEHTVEVEANSLEEAKEKAYEIVMNGPDTGYDTESLGTLTISANSVLVN